jgi:hypothetical protein
LVRSLAFDCSIVDDQTSTYVHFAPPFAEIDGPKFAIGSIFISPFSAAVGIFLFVLTVYYAYVVWGRIPFAATNLVVATTAVKSNLGLSIFAYSSLPVIIGWSCWWLVSFASTVYVTSGCDAQGNCATETPGILVFSMLLSYHWTCQVIKNVVHVTVAGAVGTWWFVPSEGTSFCSHGVRDSFVRSITTSFGSICLGSLLVAIVEALRSMVRSMRENGEGGILLCLAECLLSCLQDMMEVSEMRRVRYYVCYHLLFSLFGHLTPSEKLTYQHDHFSISTCGPLYSWGYMVTPLSRRAKTY